MANMNRSSLLAGLLLFVLVVPCAYAVDDDKKPHDMSPEATIIPDDPIANGWFGAEPKYDTPYNAQEQLDIYGAKHLNKTAIPPVELGIRLYDRGAYTPRPTWLGRMNPIGFSFMSYGDLRIAAADYDNGVAAGNGKTNQSAIAARLNVDMDLAITATERIHAFTRPIDKGGSFTSYQINGGIKDKFIHHLDFNLDTLFFEGDVGAIVGGIRDKPSSFDLPIAIGRIPFTTQNGVWIEDAFNGVATSITARNSAKYDISNTDVTFFAGFDKVTTDADPGDKTKVFGLAGFADARKGYIEYGYGFVRANNNDLSYHNVTAAFSRRYRGRLANSIRLIGNFGQKGVAGAKTADGVLLLVENSFMPRYLPWGDIQNLVPYVNLFAGFDNPQSLARGGDAGGVLRNTGINFESDGLTRYPTLDARARDSYGGAAGMEYLFDLHRQIVVELATVQRMNNNILGSEYALGARYQRPLNNAWILRLDAMRGWREGRKNIYGARVEIRRKF
jgi:hypothetical protein